MIEVTDEIQHLVAFFQSGFTILIALALGEALRQFVAGDIRHPDDKAIQWNRLPALLIFLFLILPFFQGMNRYFYLTYLKTGSLPKSYPSWLAIDGLAFISESALFFVMSRLFSETQWRRFFQATLVLLSIDTLWAISVALRAIADVTIFIILNCILGAVMLGFVLWFPKKHKFYVASLIVAFIAFCTTVASYILLRNFFFP